MVNKIFQATTTATKRLAEQSGKALAGHAIFSASYRDLMQKPLQANPMRKPGAYEQIAGSRMAAIESIKNGQWSDSPLISIINGQSYSSADIQKTFASLTGEVTGLKQVLSPKDFASWSLTTKKLQQQPLAVNVEKIQQLNQVIDNFSEQQSTPQAIGQILAEVFVDFNAEKTAEIDERFDTQQRHTDFCQKTIQDLINGKLTYAVSKAGIVVAPVVNFGTLLDVQQKTLHCLRHGIKVTWLVRQGEAAQQVTREILRLHTVLTEHDLADMLDIVVLSVEQRDEFFKSVALPTLATGRADSMIAIQDAAKDASTSGSGNSADISLDASISLTENFAQMVMRDATVAGNGRQCTALQVAIINTLPQKFAQLAAQQFQLHETPQQANQAAFEQETWYAAYASPTPTLPQGTTQIHVDHQSLAFYDANNKLLGEDVTWGKLGVGLVSTDKVSCIVDYVKKYPWLSIGYVPNLENEASANKEIQNFLSILQAAKATVGTFNGPCVFSAPQNTGEIFGEGTTHRIGKLIVSHSPMQAPVPRGPQLWGPSQKHLAHQSQQASVFLQQLAEKFSLDKSELGYLVEVQQYLQDAAKPHIYDRDGRGPSVEGLAMRTPEDKVSKYIPAQCYVLKNAIQNVDIAVGLLLLTQTNWQACTDAVLIHSTHENQFHNIEQFLRQQTFKGEISLCDDPQTANTTEVEAFPSTQFYANDTYRQVDDVIATFGARMMHLKFLNVPNQTTATLFKQHASENFPWLRYQPEITS